MGIRKNELRIGNWVRWNYEESSEGNVYPVEYGYELDDIKNNPNIVKPIPLSEEWLLKFGFESVNSFINNEIWRVTNYHKGNEKYGLKLFKGINDPECLYFFHGNVGLKIEYVHQLQNLYFALTGEELTIKTIDQW